jgi:hypothetical protein
MAFSISCLGLNLIVIGRTAPRIIVGEGWSYNEKAASIERAADKWKAATQIGAESGADSFRTLLCGGDLFETN